MGKNKKGQLPQCIKLWGYLLGKKYGLEGRNMDRIPLSLDLIYLDDWLGNLFIERKTI